MQILIGFFDSETNTFLYNKLAVNCPFEFDLVCPEYKVSFK